jgi:hypothetical protein
MIWGVGMNPKFRVSMTMLRITHYFIYLNYNLIPMLSVLSDFLMNPDLNLQDELIFFASVSLFRHRMRYFATINFLLSFSQ